MLDLFSGIGGFALAAQWVWGDELEIVSFCEIDKFCQKVLKKHWPDVPCCEDIRRLTNEWITANIKSDRLEELGQKRFKQGGIIGNNTVQIDLLTGGFPCQPYSVAGNQLGDADDRTLWPEMLRVIRETRPRWIVGENVAGIIELALEQVCASLEVEGYEVQPVIVPACAVNAPHRRDRVWIIARNTDSIGLPGEEEVNTAEVGEQTLDNSEGRYSNAPDTRQQLRKQRNSETVDTNTTERTACTANLERFSKDEWEQNWRDVAIRTCSRGVDDGFPAELDGLKLSKSKHRQERLKSLGNAIVPQVAEVIFRAIKEIDG